MPSYKASGAALLQDVFARLLALSDHIGSGGLLVNRPEVSTGYSICFNIFVTAVWFSSPK